MAFLTTQSVETGKEVIHKMKSPTVSVIIDKTGFAGEYMPAGTIIGAENVILDSLGISERGVYANVDQAGLVKAQGVLVHDLHFGDETEVVGAVSFSCVVYTGKIIDANGALESGVKSALEGNGISFYNALATSSN